MSTDNRKQEESPEVHEARGRMYAEFQEWEVGELYDLSGASGKDLRLLKLKVYSKA